MEFVQLSISRDLYLKAAGKEAAHVNIAHLLEEQGVKCDLRFNYQVFKSPTSRRKGALWR